MVALATAARARAGRVAGLIEAWQEADDLIEHWERAIAHAPDDAPGFESNLSDVLADERIEEIVDLIVGEAEHGVSLVTVLDEGYPRNLRTIEGRPPFLWIRGHVAALAWQRAVAIVGTRQASAGARTLAHAMSMQIASSGVAVLSGLALGVDTEAHEGALAAGGKTMAVMGTGTSMVYPRQNERLAEQIVESGGALVSQFMPDATGRRWSFPMRNAVMSGMALGTLVIEASETSGAKLQARIALQQGRRLLLAEPLVESEAWARRYAERRGAITVSTAGDVVRALQSADPPPPQLALC